MGEIKRDMERLAVAQALYQVVGAAVKTGDAGSLRGRADAAVKGLYDDFGVKSVELRVGDVPVGTMSVAVSSGPVVTDRAAFEAWAASCGLARRVRGVDLDRVPDDLLDLVVDAVGSVCPAAVTEGVEMARGWEKSMVRAGRAVACGEGGEVVPGLAWRSQVKNTTVRGCDSKDVAAALASMGDGATLAQILADGDAFRALPEGGDGDGE